jgi:glycosyltransferase involved in cell wall biosynthesis
MKMNVLFVLENYFPHIGGVEVVFRNLCEGLVKKGYHVDIVTHRLKGTKKSEVIGGVNIHRVNCFRSRYLFTFFSVPKVLKLAKKADIIHTTTFNAAFPAWFASKLLKKKCIITVHEVWVGRWNKLAGIGWLSAKMHDLLERLIYLLRFDKYAAVSKSTQKQLIDISVKKEKTQAIYNGIDYSHWNPKKYNGESVRKRLKLENNFVYLFTGRPGVSKGLEYLIKAVPSISKLIPNSKLLAIVSKDKAYEKRYRYILDLIKKLKIEDKVIIHNPVSYKDLPNYVKASDCVVVPSLSEGFGFAAAEACAMKIPVVASNTTSLPEVVSGRFILVGSRSPESIAEGIKNVFDGRIKDKGLKKFLLTDNINNYIKAYKKLLF